MIQKESLLDVVDNSGAKKALCIHLYNGYKKRFATVGDLIKVTIKRTRKKDIENLKIKKGDLSKGIVATVKNYISTYDGEKKSYNINSVILISDQNKYLASKVTIPLDNSIFRHTKYCKLLRISDGIII